MPTPTRFGLVIASLGMLTPASPGQSILHVFYGDDSKDEFGIAVSGAGDVNRDGFDDLIIGAYGDDPSGTNSGSVRVLSGLDGSVLFNYEGRAAFDRFGYAVSGAGDVDGDGFPDIVVGAYGARNPNGAQSGSAQVFSGKSGSILYTFYGDSDGDSFGGSVSGAGDVNRDGFDDVIVGAIGDDNNGAQSGSARVFSGKDGSVLYTFIGEPGWFLGGSVCGAGDVNRDNFADLAVGASRADLNGDPARGTVRVYSGKDGKIIYSFWGVAEDHYLGSVSGAGDVNGDGYADLIVGSTGDHSPPYSPGYAQVFSGKDGWLLHTFYGDGPGNSSDGDSFASSISGAGDVNGDGFDDLIVGAYRGETAENYSGIARVFSGLDGSILGTLHGYPNGAKYGFAVSDAGDVDGDGFADVIVGAPNTTTPYASQSGSAWVHSGFKPVGTTFCTPAATNSSGLPAVIRASGSAKAGANELFLWASDLPQDEVALFLVSAKRGFVPNPGGSQGNLCLRGNIGRLSREVQNVGACGCVGMKLNLLWFPLEPPHTVMAGETWCFQVWVSDNGSSNFTDGVSVTFR